MRLHPQRKTRASLIVLAVGVLPLPCVAATTTIDFETPEVTGFQAIDPYVQSGVTFRTPSPTCGVVGLRSRRATQVLSTSWDRVTADGNSPIVAELPIELAITFVEVELLPLEVNGSCDILGCHIAQLSLFGVAGNLLARSRVFPEECSFMLRAATSQPVTRAVIEFTIPFPCHCAAVAGPCGDCGMWPFEIDNFRFGQAPGLTLVPSLLWPPHHRLLAVHASVPADVCEGASQVTLVSVTSDEPDAGTSAEDLPNDIQDAEIGTADFDFALRSERAEGGDGRTYTACYEIQCMNGDVSQRCAEVRVPHDRRGQASLAAHLGAWSLTIYASPTMAARDVATVSVMVGTTSFEQAVATSQPLYGEADHDGREDVTLALGDSLSAVAIAYGDSLYARWEAGGQGYLAAIAPSSVTGVSPAASGTLQASVRPNPGLGYATLNYVLPRAGEVRLAVFDIAGHQVASLVGAWQPGGPHSTRFVPRARAGIYLYRLAWEGQSASGKFAVFR